MSGRSALASATCAVALVAALTATRDDGDGDRERAPQTTLRQRRADAPAPISVEEARRAARLAAEMNGSGTGHAVHGEAWSYHHVDAGRSGDARDRTHAPADTTHREHGGPAPQAKPTPHQHDRGKR